MGICENPISRLRRTERPIKKGDIRDLVRQTYRIVATYVKDDKEETFTRRVYQAKKIDYDRLTYPDDWGDRPRLIPD